MNPETIKLLEALNGRLEEIARAIAPRQKELYKNPRAIVAADFFEPLKQTMKEAQALMQHGKNEVLDKVKSFKAQQEEKLAKLRAKKAARTEAQAAQAEATAQGRFRRTDHGITAKQIDKLAREFREAIRSRRDKRSGDWTNW
ncbi:MAG: hypothetical protein AB7K24_07110 [Gemmataceae bacterium]